MEKVSTTGIVYLIQPAELVGTNRFKVGCSSKNTLERVQKGYRKGTRYLYICECEHPFVFEKKIKHTFNTLFKLIAGTEYFEGDESNITECFRKEFELYQTSLKLNSKTDNTELEIKESDMIDLDTNESNIKLIRLLSLLENNDDSNENIYTDLFMFRALRCEINPFIRATKIKLNDDNEFGEYIVDCESNFNDEQKNIIIENNIFDIEDILRSDKIDKISKQKSLECYKYVKDKYEICGIEPYNGHTIIKINDIVCEIRINNNGFVVYIQPMKSDFNWNNYHIIKMT